MDFLISKEVEMSEVVKKEIVEWAKAIAVALVIGVFIYLCARPSFIVGSSMLPTFQEGDMVLVERVTQFFSEPKVGDIVVAQSHIKLDENRDKVIIKRVIGLPGDHIIVAEGSVYVNGEKIDDSYTFDKVTDGELDEVVPKDHLFLLGDNRLNSNDSRSAQVGMVPKADLRGKVWFRLWPLNKLSFF